jgi:hypothetical protein
MTGGRIDAGAFAVGHGATATNTMRSIADEPGREEISRRLEELVRQLEAAEPRLDNGAEIRESTQVVAEELGKEHPNKTTVTGILTGIAGAVTSVTGLATATDALLGAVKQFL